MFRAQQPRPQRKPVARRRSLPPLHKDSPDPRGPTTANDEAIQKISALEIELAKLRAQIAQIVLAQEKTAQSGKIFISGQSDHLSSTLIHYCFH